MKLGQFIFILATSSILISTAFTKPINHSNFGAGIAENNVDGLSEVIIAGQYDGSIKEDNNNNSGGDESSNNSNISMINFRRSMSNEKQRRGIKNKGNKPTKPTTQKPYYPYPTKPKNTKPSKPKAEPRFPYDPHFGKPKTPINPKTNVQIPLSRQ